MEFAPSVEGLASPQSYRDGSFLEWEGSQYGDSGGRNDFIRLASRSLLKFFIDFLFTNDMRSKDS